MLPLSLCFLAGPGRWRPSRHSPSGRRSVSSSCRRYPSPLPPAMLLMMPLPTPPNPHPSRPPERSNSHLSRFRDRNLYIQRITSSLTIGFPRKNRKKKSPLRRLQNVLHLRCRRNLNPPLRRSLVRSPPRCLRLPSPRCLHPSLRGMAPHSREEGGLPGKAIRKPAPESLSRVPLLERPPLMPSTLLPFIRRWPGATAGKGRCFCGSR